MKFLKLFTLSLVLAFAGISVQAQQTKASQSAMSPQKALQLLKEGNERYVKNKLKNNKNFRKQATTTAKGQYPYATILSCIDSRVSAEEVFDLGNGDAFNGRVAGNIVNPDMLGSFEFATKVAGSKVLLVLGHSSCGAVKGAIDGAELGLLSVLLDRFEPAVKLVGQSWKDGEKNSKNTPFVDAVTEANVKLTMEDIKKQSAVMKEMIESGDLLLVGGIYDLESGKVTFMN